MSVTKYQHKCLNCKRSFLADVNPADCPYCGEASDRAIQVTRDTASWPDTTEAGDAR